MPVITLIIFLYYLMKAPNVFHIIFSKIFSNLTKCGRSSSSRTSSVTSHTSFGTSRFLNHSTAAFYYPSYFPILLSNEGSKLFSHNIFLILSKWRPKPHIFQKFTNKVLLSNLTKAQKKEANRKCKQVSREKQKKA